MATGPDPTLAAVVIGATGATGQCLVQTLLNAKDKVSKVTTIGRRKLEAVDGVDIASEESQGRLIQYVQDLDEVSEEKVKELCTGSHVFFNTMGTTRAVAGSAEAFRHIDMEIPVKLGKAAQLAGVPHASVLTSDRANSNSWLLFLKTKGQIEDSFREMFAYTSVFRPGYLERGLPPKDFIQKIAGVFFKGLPVSTVAEAMFNDAWSYHTRQQSGATASADSPIFRNNDIIRIAQEGKSTGKAEE